MTTLRITAALLPDVALPVLARAAARRPAAGGGASANPPGRVRAERRAHRLRRASRVELRSWPSSGQYGDDGRRASAAALRLATGAGPEFGAARAAARDLVGLSDNGYALRWNSPDFRLVIHLFGAQPLRREVRVLQRIELRDPAGHCSLAARRGEPPGRPSPARDVDPESGRDARWHVLDRRRGRPVALCISRRTGRCSRRRSNCPTTPVATAFGLASGGARGKSRAIDCAARAASSRWRARGRRLAPAGDARGQRRGRSTRRAAAVQSSIRRAARGPAGAGTIGCRIRRTWRASSRAWRRPVPRPMDARGAAAGATAHVTSSIERDETQGESARLNRCWPSSSRRRRRWPPRPRHPPTRAPRPTALAVDLLRITTTRAASPRMAASSASRSGRPSAWWCSMRAAAGRRRQTTSAAGGRSATEPTTRPSGSGCARATAQASASP